MRWLLVVVLVATACVAIYDEQLIDRRDELDENRSLFLGPEERVQFRLASRNRVYWVGLTTPLNETQLRSSTPGDEGQITYEFDLPTSDLETKLSVGDDLIVVCPGFGDKQAYDATVPNLEVGVPLRDPFQGGKCSVDGDTVYIVVQDNLVRWVPSTGAADILVDLTTTGIGQGTIAGFAVDGNRMVFLESGRLWLLDLANPTTATWLENDNPPEGNVVLNERGVLYHVSLGQAFFVSLPDRVTLNVDEAVADGGYRLNAFHDEIHLVADREENALFGDQIIYRGQGGIFAYGLDTGKVQDILLDSEAVRYFEPAVLETGELYVEQGPLSDFNVYTVQLSDVLR